MRLEDRTFRGAAFVEDRSQELLCDRLLRGGAVEVAVVEDAFVGDVLIDEAQTGGRVDDDVAHAVLPDHAALQIAEARLVWRRQRSVERRGLLAQRRLHLTLFLKEWRE